MAELTHRESTVADEALAISRLMDVLELHRKNGSLNDLYFLPSLCFDLPETADGNGVRFVLWQPIAEFLRFGFEVEVQEVLCHGHLAIVFLDHEAANFARRISREVELIRRVEPRSMISSGPEIRKGDHSDLPFLRAQLSELAGSAGEEEVRRCIDVMRRAETERSWPANSSALLSERSLARDWLNPEEDAAWGHL
jgi:hypothetical protein